jgi:hypothetical protein
MLVPRIRDITAVPTMNQKQNELPGPFPGMLENAFKY